MTRLLLLDPVGVDIHTGVEAKVARATVGPDVEVVVRHLDGLPPTVYVPPVPVITPLLAQAASAAQDEGFDAVGIGCCSDPGLEAAKNAADIPVTGPFESLTWLVRREPGLAPVSVFFNVSPPGPGESTLAWEDWGPKLVDRYGATRLFGAAHAVATERPEADFADGSSTDPTTVGDALIKSMRGGLVARGRQALAAAALEGSRSVFLACTYWAGLKQSLASDTGLRVLDPIETLATHLAALAKGEA
jgi:allantoin racemase